MKKLLTTLALLTSFFASSVFAAEATCEMKAADKKLAGAAKNSFVKKCEKDTQAESAGSACEARAVEKKIYGAAKNSFVKKCKADGAT